MQEFDRILEAKRQLVADKEAMKRLAERINENEYIVAFWKRNGRHPYYWQDYVRVGGEAPQPRRCNNDQPNLWSNEHEQS
jgi:hypothetical protein